MSNKILDKPPSSEWRILISRFIRSEMQIRCIRLKELRDKLAENGVDIKENNLRNKIHRGIMGADMFVQILHAMGSRTPEEAEIEKFLASIRD